MSFSSNFLKAVFHKIYLVHSWVLCPIQSNQSDFEQGGYSCTYQYLCTIHEMYWYSDDGFEVRSIFLDVSKSFDKLWHKGLISRLNQIVVTSDIILFYFPKERK